MSLFSVAVCLTLLLNSFVEGSEQCDARQCETCHHCIEKMVPDCCSKEKKFVCGLSKVNWFQALEDCEMIGCKLASITSQNDTENLLKYIKEIGMEDRSFWLSGTDVHKEGDYIWYTSPQIPFEAYTNWYPGAEPNNNNDWEDCIHVWAKGTWNDRSCYDNLFYCCEYYLTV